MTKEALVGAMRQRVLDRLSACLPGLAQVDAVRLVAAANADKRRGLRELDAFLQRGLDVLVSASSDTPPGAFRLLVLLEGEGHPVRVPVCAECGLRRTHLPGRGGRGRVCQSCAAKARAGRPDP